MTITEKIKQIIAKAKSTTSEAEAEALMAKAVDLMQKHQIDAWSLGADDPLGFNRSDPRPKSGPSSYRPKLLAKLAAYYGCKVIYCQVATEGKHIKYSLEYCGPESARITTDLMMEYVWEQVVAEADRLSKEGHGDRGQMLRHVVNALCIRLDKLTAQAKEPAVPTEAAKNALVKIGTEVETYFGNRYSNVTMGRKSTIKWKQQAGAAASNISLHRQTGATATKRIGQ